MGKRRGTIFTWERDIETQFSNVIFSFVIDQDETKIGLYESALRSLKIKSRLIQALLSASAIFLLLASTYAIEKLESPLLSSMLLIITMYLFLVVVSLALFRPLLAIPISHQILIHAHPKGFPNLVIITKYLPKGQSFFAIPVEAVGSVGIAKRSLTIPPRKLEIETLEIVLSSPEGKIIAKFGGLCKESDIRAAAIELWKKILEIKEKP
ncbi:MAG: hypothetical protein QXF65_03680 [Candidatus Korarchaeota archaeon]